MEERLAASPLSRDEITKHWLLNLAVEFEIFLTRIFPRVKEQGLNTRAVPYCTSEDYARNLLELINSGMIVLSSELEDDDLTDHHGVSRVLDRFLALPNGYERIRDSRPGERTSLQIDHSPALRVSFKLTEQGGEAWEKTAQPDWSRLLIERSDFQVADFYSANRDLLAAYMGWYAELNEALIMPRTVQWERCANSQIVYWKNLPIVYHAWCRLETIFPANTPEWLWEWYTSATSWRKKPWELTGWPPV